MSVFVILPALNEEHGILETINQIKNYVPSAKILVVDNGSTDRTIEIVKAAQIQIVFEPKIGKGFAVRRAFSYLPLGVDSVFIVDSDGTYSVSEFSKAHQLIVEKGFDMVVGNRKIQNDSIHGRLTEFRSGHIFGNWAISKLSKILQPSNILDSLSGWRVMSPEFVRSFTGGASGFEIESELNAHASLLQCAVTNIDVQYQGRHVNSESKLHTYRDGFKIIRMIMRIFRDNRPLLAFSLLSFPWLLTSFIAIGIAIKGYLSTGLVLHFPSLIAGVGMFIIGVQLIVTGMILERVKNIRLAMYQYAYRSSRN